MKQILAMIGLALGTLASPLAAESWTLSGEGSHIAFGSVKKDTIGEVHSFSGLSGTIGADGLASVEIDLGSVETNIDIRNERMAEHVFKGIASAAINMTVEMEDVTGLGVGETTTTYVEGALSLLGTDVPIEAELFVVRISEIQVLVTTNDMIYVSTADLGIDAGVDTLMELAKLPGITRTVPITARFLFELDPQKAEAAPAASPVQVAMDLSDLGDAKKGRRVFNKCKACHKVNEGQHGVGPSLFGVFGASAGAVDGFKYSSALAEADIIWTPETLAAFLAKPRDYIKGNKMSFPGLKKESDIADVLAYLADKAMP